jgi:glucitol operon activator protein
MASWQVLLVAWVVLWALQSVGTWYQTQRYFGKIKQLQTEHAAGFLGAGHARRRLGIGAIVIVITDANLKVTRLLMMRGMTVLATFKDQPEFVGLSIAELQARLQAEPEKSSFRDATTSAINQILRVEREGVAAKQQPQQMAHA